MAESEKYTRQTASVEYDPELQTNTAVSTMWTDDAWNRAQEASRKYQEYQQWRRNHPFLAAGRSALSGLGNFVNDELLLNKGNIRALNAQANPEVMDQLQQAGNFAGSLVAAPFVLESAPTWAPWAGRALWNGLKWRYTTPSGWILGTAAELPQVANAAEASTSENDNRSRAERLWDYVWDNPGKTFMTLAGVQAGYNWAKNKWGTPAQWKYGEAAPGSKAVVPYDADYASRSKSLFRTVGNNVKGFVKQNWLSVPAAIYGGWQFGDWLFSNPNSADQSTNSQNTNESSTQLPDGFVPVKGIDSSTGQIIVPTATGDSDSLITIEPITRNRFGRGDNQGQ